MDDYLPNCYNDVNNMEVECDNSEDSDFQLGEVVTFGYSKVCASQMIINEDGLSARKKDPAQFYAYGVVYGEKALSGVAEFELEIVRYGSGWSGTVKLGVVKVTEDKELSVNDVPRYSPDAPGYCVWCADKLYNNLQEKSESSYGGKNLDSLRAGSRVGLRVDSNGNLTFLVDGHSQGVASKNVVSKGHKLYVVVDHYANCIETRITRAGEFLVRLAIPVYISNCLITQPVYCMHGQLL